MSEIIKKLVKLSGKSIKYVNEIYEKTIPSLDYFIEVVFEGNEVIKLGLSHCGLTTLPESFGQLESLQNLILANNKLTTLPESFGKLKSLKELYFYDNQLMTLPKSLGDLDQLTTLILVGNPLSAKDQEIYDKGVKAVIEYCKNIKVEKIRQEEERKGKLEEKRRKRPEKEKKRKLEEE